mgnify:CR=1 FL=1
MDFKSIALNLPMNRGQYGLTGAILMLIGLVLIGLTVLIIQLIQAQAAEKLQARQGAVTACAQALQDLGLQVTPARDGRSIVGRLDGIDGAAAKIGRASAGALLCPGWRMTGFCFGEACRNRNGLWLELRPG